MDGYWVEKVFKSHSAYQNPDLPPICQDSAHWSKEFIPTMLLWCGQQESIWKLTDTNILPLVEMFSVIYLDILLTKTIIGHQRIIEWQRNFGSTALAIMNDFFAHNKDVGCQALALALHHKCTFIYQDMDTPVKEEGFRSIFVLQLLATIHIHATITHIDVPSLNTKKLALCGVSDTLSVSCAAHTILCMHNGVLDANDVLMDPKAQLKRKPKTPKALNEATGKESMTKYAFSAQNWKFATLGYFHSVCKGGMLACKLLGRCLRTFSQSVAQTVLSSHEQRRWEGAWKKSSLAFAKSYILRLRREQRGMSVYKIISVISASKKYLS
ncbi:hypothetical protein PAXRUDRAFT_796085 [Paxillus rubicundulus Ve08.2h10]|uniref:Uncharacterized protein n=1 Tax=Paxillus rubicundulus Ve08.2h10 TaxID=930991 RepID=A0A0D0DTC1_9AGAM|nr:hypothetical protein PAXRUDRAFT_796085 [Paxillus rubicundulus Ve08.2h10]